MEVTGKNQDECMVALHDCNEDVSRAINFLLESTSDMVNDLVFHLTHPKLHRPAFHFFFIIRLTELAISDPVHTFFQIEYA